MKYSFVAKTDMKVSRICLGTMTFGTPVEEKDAVRLVHYARDKGINFVDTANMYEGYARVPGSSGGVAEKILGKAVKGSRQEYIIATKLGMKVGEEPEDEFTSPAAIVKQLDRSLKNLDTDYIDIYYLHKYDPNTTAEELCLTLEKQLKAGKIRSYAVSNYSEEQLRNLVDTARVLGIPAPVMCQPSLSLLNTNALETLLPYCQREGISVVPYQVLQGGILTGKYKRGAPAPTGSRAAEMPSWVGELDSSLYDKLEEFERNAAGRGLSMTQYALAWALSQPAVVSALVGVKNEKQIDEAAVAGEV